MLNWTIPGGEKFAVNPRRIVIVREFRDWRTVTLDGGFDQRLSESFDEIMQQLELEAPRKWLIFGNGPSRVTVPANRIESAEQPGNSQTRGAMLRVAGHHIFLGEEKASDIVNRLALLEKPMIATRLHTGLSGTPVFISSAAVVCLQRAPGTDRYCRVRVGADELTLFDSHDRLQKELQ